MSDPGAVLGLEPDDLDGHTLDELEDYLDAGREPADPSIDDSPACQIALGALQRLRALAGAYLDQPVPADDAGQGWIANVLAVLPLEARAGRAFPLPVALPDTTGSVTEGALRGLIRDVGDHIPGLLVGRVHILPRPGATVADLEVEIALVYGAVLQEVADALRAALREQLARHAPFEIRRIDVRLTSVVVPTRQAPR